MCGRFQLSVKGKTISERFNVEVFDEKYKPSYNCAPGQFLPVITNAQPKELQHFFWGFVPEWAAADNKLKPLINSRAETIADKPAFKNAFQMRRCLVPANGFYEWKTDANKQPYRIFLKSEKLFAMAGIWSSTQQADGTIHDSFSIVTTAANKMMIELHHRMPLILKPEEEQIWLFEQDVEKLKMLLKPAADGELEKVPVSSRINAVKNNDERLILPQEAQRDLFSDV